MWIDSGGDGEWRSGGFVKLLSWLRNETYEETCEYLLTKYVIVGFIDTDELKLDFSRMVKKKTDVYEDIPWSALDRFRYTHTYLERVRGIEERYQRALKIGYDIEKQAISMPILDKNGNLVNIKFRSVNSKVFWYYNNNPVRDHLYLLFLCISKKVKRVFIVESEIDAITLWKHGFPAVAVMGSSLTDKQRTLLLDSGIETIVIATDNDKTGRRLARSIHSKLGGYMIIERMDFPEYFKDVNDLPTNILIDCATNTKEWSFDLLL